MLLIRKKLDIRILIYRTRDFDSSSARFVAMRSLENFKSAALEPRKHLLQSEA